VIRGVKRYNESAKIECDILIDIQNKGGAQSGIVYLKEYFHFQDKETTCAWFLNRSGKVSTTS
jgi:hypothetical protein